MTSITERCEDEGAEKAKESPTMTVSSFRVSIDRTLLANCSGSRGVARRDRRSRVKSMGVRRQMIDDLNNACGDDDRRRKRSTRL